MVKRILRALSGKPPREEIDIESYLHELHREEEAGGDFTYLVPIEMDAEGKDTSRVVKELEKNNLVVLNLKALLPRQSRLKEVIEELQNICAEMDGDIGRISNEKVIIVPNGMRIVHREE